MKKFITAGFTLLELMIVVGIVSILVAIAAPALVRYQSKARQSEAKMSLAHAYQAEKTFYAAYAAYATSLDAIGYAPEGAKRFYSVGFGTNLTTSVQGYAGGFTSPSFDRIGYPSSWTTCVDSLALGTANDTVDPQYFTIEATGQIRDQQGCDVWTIDDAKAVVNATVSL